MFSKDFICLSQFVFHCSHYLVKKNRSFFSVILLLPQYFFQSLQYVFRFAEQKQIFSTFFSFYLIKDRFLLIHDTKMPFNMINKVFQKEKKMREWEWLKHPYSNISYVNAYHLHEIHFEICWGGTLTLYLSSQLLLSKSHMPLCIRCQKMSNIVASRRRHCKHQRTRFSSRWAPKFE